MDCPLSIRSFRSLVVLGLALGASACPSPSPGPTADAGDADADATSPEVGADALQETGPDAELDTPEPDGDDADAPADAPGADADAGDTVEADTPEPRDVPEDVDADVREWVVLDDLAESAAPTPNPGRGFYTRARARGRLVQHKVHLGAFCEGTQLSPEFLEGLREQLEDLRGDGASVILRFLYADDGVLNGCGLADARDIEAVEAHIGQLAGVLSEFAPQVAWVEAGFLGMWGEWNSEHAPPNTSLMQVAQNRRRVLVALAAALPERQILVRRPRFRAEWESGPDALPDHVLARIGFHNDCFLASDTDFGTYDGDRSADDWKGYIAALSVSVGMGGETCRDHPPRTGCTVALRELEQLGFAYLYDAYHPEVLARWEDEGCMPEIRRRLGYRLVARRVEHDAAVRPGAEVELRVQLENRGFAHVRRPTRARMRLVGESESHVLEILSESDLRDVGPGETVPFTVRGRVPGVVPPGSYLLELAHVDGVGATSDWNLIWSNLEHVDAEGRVMQLGAIRVR